MTQVATTPTPLAERSLAPDLARGTMLLLIALANTPWFLWTATRSELQTTMHAIDGSLADRIAQGFIIVVADVRTYPMFAFLFAYGIGQLYARQAAKGVPEPAARRLLQRRHLWLLAFGFVHAALLWSGDILGTYGLAGLILVPLFLRRSDTVLKVWIIVLLGIGAVVSVFTVFSGMYVPPGLAGGGAGEQAFALPDPYADPNYLTSMVSRLSMWVFMTPMFAFFTLAVPTAFLIGILAARHRILDQPGAHLPLLRRLAVTGIGVSLLGSIPAAYLHLTAPPINEWTFAIAAMYTGVFGGVGYAALFGLLAVRLQRTGRTPVPVVALAALGRRSLSGYLAQSVLFIPLLAAFGIGFGAHLSSWSVALLAVVTWLLTVLGAYWMDQRGMRGPAEVLLRRLTYRRSKADGLAASNEVN
ncbi:DUF418 domain-containing protein [Naumannella halotolerans]|uniref:DUF418 domain-containing protein n=1 Tax=Naumannella halotolerans TaxID=993414 RepID=UPI00370D4888